MNRIWEVGTRKASLKWITKSLELLPLGIAVLSVPAFAQIVPDNTLGAESSRVNSNINIRGLPGDRIEGGAARGSSLFHSFSEFNVNNGQRIYFANPAGIANIFSRVTGSNVSNILGTLGVEGAANLFLLNPNGILFGPNARLDIQGSFVASTARGFQFSDGSEFSATNPQAAPLLTMSVPLGVQYGSRQGDITNQASLSVNPGQTLRLLGNTVISTGALVAPGGRVELLGNRVGLDEQASIDVSSATGGGAVLIGGDYQGQGNLPTAARTYIGPNVTISANALTLGEGGRVIIWSDEVTGFYGRVNARGGTEGGKGGFVEVSSRQNLQFDGLVDVSAPIGAWGTLLLDPNNITISNVSSPGVNDSLLDILQNEFDGQDITISAENLQKQTGNIILQAANSITINSPLNFSSPGGSIEFAAHGNGNNGGSITVNQNANIHTNGRDITFRTHPDGTPPQGTVTMNGFPRPESGWTPELRSQYRSLWTDSDANRSGNVFINTGTLTLNHYRIGAANRGSGNAGSIQINSQFVTLKNQSFLASDLFNSPNVSGRMGGQISINASGAVSLSGDSFINAHLSQEAQGTGGSIAIKADSLSLEDSSMNTAVRAINGNSPAQGQAGDINIQVNNVTLTRSIIASGVEKGVENGTSGQISLNAHRVELKEGSVLRTSAEGNGGGSGNVLINVGNGNVILSGKAPRELSFDSGSLVIPQGQGSGLIASTSVNRKAGNINISAGSLSLLDGAEVQADSKSPESPPGDITLSATNQVLIQDSKVTIESQNNKIGYGRVLIEATEGPVFLNSATISAKNSSSGYAGDIFIDASDRIEITNSSRISADGNFGRIFMGNGDNEEVNSVSPQTLVINNSKLTTNNPGTAQPGNNNEPNSNPGIINIQARQITLDNKAEIRADSASADGGDLTMEGVERLVMRRGSVISAEAGSKEGNGGNGGNITIQARNGFVIAVPSENSDIIANAFQGNGGQISIEANRIFGLQDVTKLNLDTEQVRNWETSDLSASSQFGEQGQVALFSLTIDPSQGLAELPIDVVDPSSLIATGCGSTDETTANRQSEFIVTGRGGLPPSPDDLQTPGTTSANWVTRDVGNVRRAALPERPPTTASTDIPVEAQGMVKAANGQLLLTAQPTTATPHQSGLSPHVCVPSSDRR